MQEQGVSIVKIKIGKCSSVCFPNSSITPHLTTFTNYANQSLGPIERECVNTLLSEVLCLPPSLCRPLSIAVHNKTGGIILFILKFLASLNDEGDLWFSMSSHRWVYNLDEIRSKEIHDDVVSHMTEVCSNSSRFHCGKQHHHFSSQHYLPVIIAAYDKFIQGDEDGAEDCGLPRAELRLGSFGQGHKRG